MPKKDLTKNFKKLFSSREADSSRAEITPYRDWLIIVIVFFVGIVASVLFNIYLSMQINSDSFSVAGQKNPEGLKLNHKGLTEVLDNFSAKETAFEKLKTEGVTVVDPSL
ncbi:MAG: hypothetical protein PHS95_01120 [Candidatus Pacebacteria bacterium]|nr:hypothetical protein [Candidatus Paceibacterota bacterium]